MLCGCADEPTTTAPREPEPPPRKTVTAPEEPFAPLLYEVVDPDVEPLRPAETVEGLIAERECSTGKTTPLNDQIAAEINCVHAGAFSPIDHIPNVDLGPGASPFMQTGAAEALERAARHAPYETLEVNSSWRSPVQQLILKSWQGSCGVSLAASPGQSKHESGLAIDVPLWTIYSFHEALGAEGWQWFCDATNRGLLKGCRDIPHYALEGEQDLGAAGIKAFQRLWNHSNPGQRLNVTGHFDPQTAARMRKAPLRGFDKGSTCRYNARFDPCPVAWRDVPRRDPYFEAIEAGRVLGIWESCDARDRWFCPSRGASRAELAAAIARALDLEILDFEGIFIDVAADHSQAREIEAVARAGISAGCDAAWSPPTPGSPGDAPEGALESTSAGDSGGASKGAQVARATLEGEPVSSAGFCPDAPVTWDQAAALIARGRNLTLRRPRGRFSDVPRKHWAASHIEAAAAAGFLKGCGKGRFCPEWRLSRARMAQFVVKAFDVPKASECLGYSAGAQ